VLARSLSVPSDGLRASRGIDEDFFAYMEDLDLDMRLQLAGYPFLYLPQATVRHIGSGSTGYRSDFATYTGSAT
jgi:GT2 family glycosyltransferase